MLNMCRHLVASSSSQFPIPPLQHQFLWSPIHANLALLSVRRAPFVKHISPADAMMCVIVVVSFCAICVLCMCANNSRTCVMRACCCWCVQKYYICKSRTVPPRAECELCGLLCSTDRPVRHRSAHRHRCPSFHAFRSDTTLTHTHRRDRDCAFIISLII